MDDQMYRMLLLENQLCFPLYACSREMIRLYKPYLDQLELTYTQYITMMVLWERGSATVKEVGKALYLDSGTLTPLLKKLEAKGLLTRKRSTEDERNLIVSITEKGLALRDKAVGIPGSMAGCVALDPEETGTLYRLLYKLLSYVDDERA
ncbi:MAG: MarR family transcriptional regulator [Oscillospiraceae bacterium]|jgi:DNA-binding MarR family transcriptional regulator|nr:MarR family transcriptional regulator [Oscillospiraceae bacterium]